LTYRDFEFLICQANHIVNRRPIAFKEALRDKDISAPDPITPENLIFGHDLISFNIIPESNDNNSDIDFRTADCPVDFIRSKYFKLQKVRNKLTSNYHNEFLKNLMDQAVSQKNRYLPVLHKPLKQGDIV
jgi:hypothetical protein